VDWEAPKLSDFEAFESVMQELPFGKTLVHCAANFRVTAFYSLYALKHLGWSEAQADAFPGFRVREVPIRSYPEAEAFSHLLGYTGAISPGELDRLGTERYDRADYVGKAGVELVYEKFLHGQNGEHRVEVDATGKTQQVLGELPAKPGQTLVLNIDRELQLEIFRAFRARNPNGKGAVVAMDPKSGAVLALLSVPGYDTNQFAHGIKSAEYQQLLENKQLPLFNRVLSGTYPPGSTVKPMVLTAGLSEGAVTERTVINDRGALVIPNQFDPRSATRSWVGSARGSGPWTRGAPLPSRATFTSTCSPAATGCRTSRAAQSRWCSSCSCSSR
jgi:cell division protein FtsI/penicillin-binding protein 2